ncbi:hypothetical protein EJ02DRAFT_460776 [Clathrospora elynae]|uniref:F-box domain-containing protein n=1 Tax=Clathrospora elynae TaxID=706981 RepID=A0A6A5S660_9PLEO|nr:hypothetical protein EJ02DRAFT_460776 [Clathrospora elynae]
MRNVSRSSAHRRAGFLDLAGELRNQIYELVMINDENDIGITELVHYPRSQYQPQAYSYRGLVHVSRQVREEFFPLYQTRIVYVEIDVRDVARFVDTFYDLENAQALAQATGSIEISLDRNPRPFDADVKEVDLLPLLRLLILAPNVHARFVATKFIREEGMPQIIHDLGILLRMPKVVKVGMRHHLLYTINRLVLSPLPSPKLDAPVPELRILLSSEASPRAELIRVTGLSNLQAVSVVMQYS